MLPSGYKRLSTNRSIVLIYFCTIVLATILSLNCVNARAFTNAEFSHSGPNKRSKISNVSAHQDLEQQLYTFIEQSLADNTTGIEHQDDIRIEVRPIDERIIIERCSRGYDFTSNSNLDNQSNISVKVTCGDSNWYLFMHANVAIIQNVVVTSDNLSPGSLLNANNVKVIEMDKNRLRGSSFNTIEEVIGARLKRRTRANNVIDDRMLCFICKGDRVTIAAVSSGLSIKVYGVAEQDGVLGDTITVRNLSSDKQVHARIVSTSQVEINI